MNTTPTYWLSFVGQKLGWRVSRISSSEFCKPRSKTLARPCWSEGPKEESTLSSFRIVGKIHFLKVVGLRSSLPSWLWAGVHSLCCYRPLAFSFLQVSSSKFKAATANEILLTTGISLTACVATDHPWLLGSEETHPVHLLLLRPTVPHHKAQSPEGNLITSVSSRDGSEQYVFFPPPPNSSPILSECWLAVSHTFNSSLTLRPWS